MPTHIVTKHLADQLKAKRRSLPAHNKQIHIATNAGIGLEQLRNLEQARGNVQLGTLIKLLDLYDLTIELRPRNLP